MAKEKDDRKKITLLVQPKIHKAASIKLAEEGGVPAGYSFQTVLESLLDQWTGGQREAHIAPKHPTGPDRYRDDVERLLRVLEKGSASDRSLIRGLITMADDALTGQKSKDVPVNPSQSSKTPPNRPQPRR